MRLLGEKEAIEQAIEVFIHQYGLGTYGADTRGIKVGAELLKLDLKTATVEEVTKLIGNPTWVEPERCEECGARSYSVVQIGEHFHCEGPATCICLDCLRKAMKLAEEAQGERIP